MPIYKRRHPAPPSFLSLSSLFQVTDPATMKSFIFQKGWVTASTKKKREAAAANATLQVGGGWGMPH